MNKEAFIERAVAVHGDKFDYSLLPDEFKSKDKVPVVCDKHGVFYITSGNHVNNKRGCAKCGFEHVSGIKRQKSKIRFFEECPKIHNNKYDYSLVKFEKLSNKVTIICPVHGEFDQLAESHLNGLGCFKCGRKVCGEKQKDTTETFIEKAIEIHGNLYDYSLVDYVNQQEKVKIVCKVHGVFEQKPNNHLHNNGCPMCLPDKLRDMFMMKVDQFEERVATLHPNLKVDYTHYRGAHEFIPIGCILHGKSLIRARHLLLGHGCKKCGYEKSVAVRRKDESHFIDSFNEVHSNKYDYSLSKFSHTKERFNVICPIHGEFTATVHNHLKGKGCPKCAQSKSGFRSDRAGVFYILKITEDCYKFGISNKFENRLRSIQKKCCFDIDVLYKFEFDDGYLARSIEADVIASNIVKGVISKADMRSGYTETFYARDISKVLSIVEKYMPVI